MAQPSISVVILVWNKEYEMGLVLEGFRHQTLPSERFEVVVLDDGSDDSLEPLIARYEDDFRIVYERLPHTGNRGKNRDRAISLASAPFLLFLDGDMIPDREFLADHLRELEADPRCLTMGMRNFLVPFNQDLITPRTIDQHMDVIRCLPALRDERTWYFRSFDAVGFADENPWYIVYSNNLGISRDFYDEIGGFNHGFSKGWGAEDVELGLSAVKAGGHIRLLRDTDSYHIDHPEKWYERRKALRINVEYLHQLHMHWETELFVFEHLCWPTRHVRYRKSLLAQEHLTRAFDAPVPKRCVSLGVVAPSLVESTDATVLAGAMTDPPPGSTPLLGLATPFDDGEFSEALVSGNYRKVSEGFFEAVLMEARRIAEHVVVVEPSGDTAPAASTRPPRPKLKLMVSPWSSNATSLNAYGQLAYHLADRGVDVAIDFTGDPFREYEPFRVFFAPSAEKRERLTAAADKDFGFFEPWIPTLMDGLDFGNRVMALDRKVHWREVQAANQEYFFRITKNDDFDFYLNRKRSDFRAFDQDKPNHYLPLGVDAQILRTARAPLPSSCRFVWIEPLLTTDTDALALLAAFRGVLKESGGAKPPELTLVYGDPLDPKTGRKSLFEILNKPMAEYIVREIEIQKQLSKTFEDQLQAMAEPIDHVKLIKKNMDEPSLAALIAEHTHIIDTNPSRSVSPFVLMAAGLGRTVLTLHPETYEDYLPPARVSALPAEPRPGLSLGPPIEGVWYRDVRQERHFVFRRANGQALGKLLAEAARNPPREYPLEETEAFLEKFNWPRLAKMFEEIFGDMMFSYPH